MSRFRLAAMTGRRRSATLAIMLLLAVGYAAFGVVVPSRLFAVGPGPAPEVISLVLPRAGAEGRADSTGRLLVTTIVAAPATPRELVRAWLDPLVDLWPRSVLVPRGMNDEAYEVWGLAAMAESQHTAAAAAWSFLGRSTAVVSDGLKVLFVDPEGPGSGRIGVDDVVVAWRIGETREPAYLPDRFETRVTTVFWTVWDAVDDVPLELEVKRHGVDGPAEVVRLPLSDASIAGWPFLGLALAAVGPRTQPAVPVDFIPGDIGGPSAGLMVALQIVDYFSPEDLTGGRVVAGSGTIGPGGMVGRVGGIEKKLAGALEQGAALFLVPSGDYPEALAAAAGQGRADVTIIPVDSLEEAYQAVLSLTGQNVAGYNSADLPPELLDWAAGSAVGR